MPDKKASVKERMLIQAVQIWPLNHIIKRYVEWRAVRLYDRITRIMTRNGATPDEIKNVRDNIWPFLKRP